jgi:hypothetical protein
MGIKYIVKAYLISIGIGGYLYFYIKQNKLSAIGLSYSIFWMTIFQIIIISLQMFNNSFRNFFYSTIILDDHWRNFSNLVTFRPGGLSGLSVYDTAISYSLLFGLTLYLLKSEKRNKPNKFIWMLLSFIFLILLMMSGRSGLLLFLAILPLIFISQKNKVLLIKYFSLFSCIFLFFIYNLIDINFLQNSFSFAFELFIKGFHTASTDDLLQNHLFVPILNNYFLGEGIWPLAESGYKYSSDSGFVLSYIYLGISGIILSIISLSLYFRIYYNIFSISVTGNLNKIALGIILFLFVSFFILKGPLFFSEKFISSLIVASIFYKHFKSVQV